MPMPSTPGPMDCGASTIINDTRFVLDGGPGIEPGACVESRRSPIRDVWYGTPTNQGVTHSDTPCFRRLRRRPRPIAGFSTECPRLFPELLHRRHRCARRDQYHYDPSEPEHEEVPAVLRHSVIIGEFTQDTMREFKHDGQNRCSRSTPPGLRRRLGGTAVRVRVRQPDGHAVRVRRLVLPADLR